MGWFSKKKPELYLRPAAAQPEENPAVPHGFFKPIKQLWNWCVAKVHCWRADQAMVRKDYEVAIPRYWKSIEVRPSLRAWRHLGDAYGKCKEYDSAIECYNWAERLEENPRELARIYGKAAAIYRMCDDREQAEKCYNENIRLEPQNHLWYGKRGDLYYHYRCYPEAIADYTRAIELQAGNPHKQAHYYYKRGQCHEHKPNPDYKAALADYEHPAVLGWQFWPQAIEAVQRMERRLNEQQQPYWRGKIGMGNRSVATNKLPVVMLRG